jgi:hypothetical protein
MNLTLFTFFKKITMIPAGYHGNFFFKKFVDPQLRQIRCPPFYMISKLVEFTQTIQIPSPEPPVIPQVLDHLKKKLIVYKNIFKIIFYHKCV